MRMSRKAALLGPSHAPLVNPEPWLKDWVHYRELELLVLASLNSHWFDHVKQVFNDNVREIYNSQKGIWERAADGRNLTSLEKS